MTTLNLIMSDEIEIYNQLSPNMLPVIDKKTQDLIFDESGKVVQHEVNSDVLIDIKPTNQFYEQVQGQSILIPYDAYIGYADVIGLDKSLSTKCELYIEYQDNIYQGMTWYIIGQADSKTKILAMMGIRVSLANIINGKHGTGRKILNAMINLCKTNNCKYLVVVWPLDTMYPLLNKFNFTESMDSRFLNVTGKMVSSTHHFYLEIN